MVAEVSEKQRLALGVGSNLGDALAVIRTACTLLAEGGLAELVVSPLYETAPRDCVPGTPSFTNGAITGLWSGSPEQLLDLCHGIEARLGRPFPHSSQEARTIDLDILLFGDRQWRAERYQIPHRQLAKRLFVLVPLRDVAAEWHIPPKGTTVACQCERVIKAEGGLHGIRPLMEASN